jgi:glycosyltransferase involved in cell wall biosynthesis
MANFEAKSGERKKRVLVLTDSPVSRTGFGRNCAVILSYLYKTGRYEIANLAAGTVDVQIGNDIERMPWKTIPAINAAQLTQIKQQNDPRNYEAIERMGAYGKFTVDKAVQDFRPDAFFSISDQWGSDFCADSPWFNKIQSALWITLDSLPITPSGIETVKKCKHFWSWADFATQELHRLGQTHVKTLHGIIDIENFYRLPEVKRQELRKKNAITPDTFIIGGVFRNQLRKSVPNMLEGFKVFKTQNPGARAKLLWVTSLIEGWDIPLLAKEFGIKDEEILIAYICKNCRHYSVLPIGAPIRGCPSCGHKQTYVTTHPSFGLDIKDLNEIYNLMDVGLAAFSSGSLEMPILELKLSSTITCVTNYACGTESSPESVGSFPLDYAQYREPGSQYVKSSTLPSSIGKQLTKVFKMTPQERLKMGDRGRDWVLKNYNVEIIGKFIADWIDSAPFAPSPDFKASEEKDDEKWLTETIKGFTGRDASPQELEELKNV